MIVGGEDEEGPSERALVTVETADLLQKVGEGSLGQRLFYCQPLNKTTKTVNYITKSIADVRLKKIVEERNELFDEVGHLKLELEEEKSKRRIDGKSGYSAANGLIDEETSKIMSDYRFKLQKAEQDVSTLQATVSFFFF